VLAFLFITPWGMTVGIALISPMLSLTSCGLRMQDPILKQKKNINAKSCQKNQINQDNQDNQVTHAKKINNSINTCTTQNQFEHKQLNNRPHPPKDINTPPPPPPSYLDKPTVPKSGACSICAPTKLPCFQSGMPEPLVNTK
jgi:hypothetical protein